MRHAQIRNHPFCVTKRACEYGRMIFVMKECGVRLLPIPETATQKQLIILLQHTTSQFSSTDHIVCGVEFARVSKFLAHVDRAVTLLNGKVLSGLVTPNSDASAQHDERFVYTETQKTQEALASNSTAWRKFCANHLKRASAGVEVHSMRLSSGIFNFH